MPVDNVFRRGESRASLQQVGLQLRLVPDPEIGLDLAAQADRLRLQRRAVGRPLPTAEQRLVRDAHGPLRVHQQSGLGHLVDEFGRGAGGDEVGAIRRANGQAAVLIDVRHQHAEQRIEPACPAGETVANTFSAWAAMAPSSPPIAL